MKRGLSLGDIPSNLEKNDNSGPFTQVESKGRGKRTKKSRFNTGTSSRAGDIVDSSINTGSMNSTNQSASYPSGPSSDEISQLKAEIVTLKQTVNQLSSQLGFVLSYLGLADEGVVGANANVNGSGLTNLSEFPPLSAPGSGSSAVFAATASAAPTSTSTLATIVQQLAPKSSNVHFGARTFREAAVAAVYADKAENDRRASSFIVHGMATSNASSDRDLVVRLCTGEFGQSPDIAFTKRLGRQLPGKVQPLLVYLKKSAQAQDIVASARQLRQSPDAFTRDNIYINENLTKAAAKAAYDERCRRRQNASQRSSSHLRLQGQGQGQGQQPHQTIISQSTSLPLDNQRNVSPVLDATVPAFVPINGSSA